MPDEKGEFLAGFLAVKGRGGELRYGFRTVSELGRWDANITSTTQDGRAMTVQLQVREHDPDPFWIEHAPEGEIVLEMRFGRREMMGPAKIINRLPKLVIEATVEEQ